MAKTTKSLGVGILLLLGACSYDIDKSGGGAQGALSGPGASLDFQTIDQGVIRSKCATCHTASQGNRGSINLETYENVFANRAAIQGAVQGGFMPPRSAAGLTAEEKSALLAWLAAGAPRNAAASPPPGPGNPSKPPPPPPRDDEEDDDDDRFSTEPSFATVFEQVFAPRCVSCHGSRGGVNLEIYDNVLANKQAIVDAVQGGFMPPASRGPLTPEQKDLLMRWIQSGAPFSKP